MQAFVYNILRRLIEMFPIFTFQPFAGRALFSPRVDYNEWLPVGRADPLKNDPTFDYSPPVLDRVRYWGDNANKEKKDILLLGVPSKRQSQQQIGAAIDMHPHASNRRNFLMPEVWKCYKFSIFFG